MAMGIVTDEELARELERNKPSTYNKPIVVQTPVGGRNPGDVNVPPAIRGIIAEEKVMNGRQAALELAHSLNISDSSVSAYSNGAHSTANYNGGNPELRPQVKSAKQKLVVKAQNRLQQALNAITPEKLQHAKLRDISGVASAMSTVIRTLEPNASENDDNGAIKRPTVVLFAPRPRQESEYETVVVIE